MVCLARVTSATGFDQEFELLGVTGQNLQLLPITVLLHASHFYKQSFPLPFPFETSVIPGRVFVYTKWEVWLYLKAIGYLLVWLSGNAEVFSKQLKTMENMLYKLSQWRHHDFFSLFLACITFYRKISSILLHCPLKK